MPCHTYHYACIDLTRTSLSTQVMYQLLHKATSTGQTSGSLSLVGQIAKIPEYLEAQRSAESFGTPRRKRTADVDDSTEPSKKAKKKVKAAAAATTPPKSKGAAEKKGGRYPDKAGSPGPNSLARMAGGNPAGEPCKDLAQGSCPYKTCSFSHK
jgi:hypothetical protein